MNKYLKFILKTISSIIVLGGVALAILMVGLKLFGFQIYTIISGSMEPNYHVGSLIYVKQVDPSTLKEQDTITFKLSSNTIVTHRIIEIVPNEKDSTKYSFRTKGDANDTPDAKLVEPNQILGKTIFTVPYLGYLATYIKSYPGNIVAICIAAFLILVVIMIDIATDDKLDENNKLTSIIKVNDNKYNTVPTFENIYDKKDDTSLDATELTINITNKVTCTG